MPTSTASRTRTAVRNHGVDTPSPLSALPMKNQNRVSSSTASAACQTRNERQRGRASASRGTSHSENCGLHTLLVTRNATTTRNSSCGSLGRRGARSASTQTPASATTSSIAAPRFSRSGASPPGTRPSRVAPPRASCRANQSESQSAGRVRLSSTKR
jgi:hypothetical protein